MKKFLSLSVICALFVLSLFSLFSCAENSQSMRLGVGIYTDVSTQDAKNGENGNAEINATAAAVVLDAKGRIIACQLDCAQSKLDFSADGSFTIPEEFLTKYEKGESYVMSNQTQPWYKQADDFEKLLVGNTKSSLKNLQNDDGKGNSDVMSAGCTILVDDFIRAVSLAIDNAQPKENINFETLSMGVSTSAKQENGNGKNGPLSLVTSVSATTASDDGKLSGAAHDAVYVDASVDDGRLSLADGAEIKSQMSRSDSNAKSWLSELATFEEGLIGKSAEELSKLTSETFSGIISAIGKAVK